MGRHLELGDYIPHTTNNPITPLYLSALSQTIVICLAHFSDTFVANGGSIAQTP